MKSIKTIISNKFLAKIVPVGLGVLILVPFMPDTAAKISAIFTPNLCHPSSILKFTTNKK